MVSIPDAAAGDVQLDALNERMALVEAALNDIDGADIEAASVPNSALAKPKHIVPITICFEALSGLSSGDDVAVIKLPPIDGEVNSTWKYLGASYGFRVCTPAASNSLVIKQGSDTEQTLDINDSGLTTPSTSMLATPVDTSSDIVWTVEYTKSGSPTYTGLTLVLFFSLEHVGT